MRYGLSVIFSLSIIFVSGMAKIDAGFFVTSSNVEKKWNPTDEFFSDERKNGIENVPLNEAEISSVLSQKTSYEEKCRDCRKLSDANEQFIRESKVTDECSQSYKKSNAYDKEELKYKAYFSRFINIFLRNTGLGELNGEEESKTVTVDMAISKRDLTVLKSFGAGGDISLEALENSFLAMVGSVMQDNSPEETSRFHEMFMYGIFSCSLLAAIIYSAYLIIKINVTRALLIFLFLMCYMAVVSFDLLQQYEDIGEKIILSRMEFENLGVPPKECYLSKLSFFEKLNSFIFKDDKCKRFLESRKSIWYKLDIASALSKPVSLVVMKLCSLLGEGAERIIKPITDKCPWPLDGVLYFILSILQLPLIIFSVSLLFSVYFSGSISLRLPFFSLASEGIKNYGKCNTPSKKNQEALEGGPSSSHIINNQGGIIVLANNDRIKDALLTEGGKSNYNLRIAQHTDYLKSLLENIAIKDDDKFDKNSKQLDILTQNEIVSKIEGGNINSEKKENFLTDNDKREKLNFSSSSDTRCGSIEGLFDKNQLVEGKLRRRKDKSIKKAHQKPLKWKNIIS